ncbi:MAG: hypothetical protein SGBAC_011944 [Bacillariaceae sp.]
MPAPAGLMAALQAKQAGGPKIGGGGGGPRLPPPPQKKKKEEEPTALIPEGKLFHFEAEKEQFLFDLTKQEPILTDDANGNADVDILVPLAPCVYRMTDYTIAKKQPVEMRRCIIKLGVLRCLQRECKTINNLLWSRLSPSSDNAFGAIDLEADSEDKVIKLIGGTIEEDELGKVRFMELLSNCGVFQKVSELILKRAGAAHERITNNDTTADESNPFEIPQIRVDGLDDFLSELEKLNPALLKARDEVLDTQTVSFYPGLGELFTPGAQLVCHPEGMEGSPLGCSCVQSWYTEELNKATNTMKRRFILVIEFMVSVGDEVVFVAASDVYPEFHDPSRNVPIRDLTHRKLLPDQNPADQDLLDRLQKRGEFYASVATHNHYLEYQSDCFFPIIRGGWSNNAVRPLSKGGRVMIDVKRGILEGHIPVRGTSDGMSDTVKEAIKLFEQNKRTGIAVPFRTAILPGFDGSEKKKDLFGEEQGDTDRPHLWQTWPMLTGFSFTARVWGKLLLSLPKSKAPAVAPHDPLMSPRRASAAKLGVQRGGLGGEGKAGNCGYITFQEEAFDQLVLAEDKKELIRAVARNAGGGPRFDEEDSDDDYDDDEDDEIGLDVVANKGAASIFLLHGPPGCGKTLTAEAIAELLKKPLYVVTAGDLGITASEVEKTLGSVLELCQTWDALVLIDEADVFLEARNSTEIQRNALVCVMLRLLEYYSGCLFLSSNRSAGSIDAAIASRITVMLGYPPLDHMGRSKVWRNLIGLVPEHPIDPETGKMPEKIAKSSRRAAKYRVPFSDEDYQELGAGYLLNGRQIKNSIVLARALARERGLPLSKPILNRAVTAVAGEEAVSNPKY